MVSILFLGCVEGIGLETQLESDEGVEDMLVVEATITDELKQHEILLSRVSSLSDTTGTIFESGAEIIVFDENGNNYRFLEQERGTYVSEIPFAADLTASYGLNITALDGTNYESDTVKAFERTHLDSIYALRTTSDDGVDGLGIFIDVTNKDETGGYLGYSYQETYKIIAPNWDPFGFILSEDGMSFTVGVRTKEERVCYNTLVSNDLTQTTTVGLGINGLQQFQVRFLGRTNPIISHRYSINVRQEERSLEAYEFYGSLESFSSSDNIFSQVQPGAIEGNITVTNGNGSVLGLFEVVSVSEKRLFFDYGDFFPNEPLPPYFTDCRIFSISTIDPILRGTVEYVGTDEENNTFFVTQRECGDCTVLGSNVVPEFWID